jgi:hypothetical protein
LNFLGWSSLNRTLKEALARKIKHQQEILEVMTVLPGKYHYKQVEAAISASGTSPRDIYVSLAANERTLALARFYEALGTDSRA